MSGKRDWIAQIFKAFLLLCLNFHLHYAKICAFHIFIFFIIFLIQKSVLVYISEEKLLEKMQITEIFQLFLLVLRLW